MRILHINRNYIFNRLHSQLIEALDKNESIENFVFVPASLEQRVKYDENERIKVVKCFNLRDRYLYFIKQRKIIKAIKRTYNISNFDLLHAYTLFTDGGCAYRLYRQYGIPYVVAIRNTDINDFFVKVPILRSYGIKIILNAKSVFFLSEKYKDILCTKYLSDTERKVIEPKIQIIPNGLEQFWINNLNNNRRTIKKDQVISALYVGRIDKNKNIEGTCKAIELLIGQGYKFQFTIIGKIEDQEVFRRVTEYSFVRYMENMVKEELLNEYRNHDLFIMPSFTETFGMTYIEAMSQGLPIIYTQGQGFDGQFDEGVVGFHVNPSSPRDITIKIENILDDYENISQNCLKECLFFDWDSIANKYNLIYKKVALKGNCCE